MTQCIYIYIHDICGGQFVSRYSLLPIAVQAVNLFRLWNMSLVCSVCSQCLSCHLNTGRILTAVSMAQHGSMWGLWMGAGAVALAAPAL